MGISPRDLLLEYVRSGKLMQVATLSAANTPMLCHVWYDFSASPDQLRFMSANRREHSANIRRNPAVAGGIVVDVPAGLGDKVRGVTFEGHAVELAVDDLEGPLESYLARWPNARSAISLGRVVDETTQARLYGISIDKWVLFDEVNFPEDPRQVVRVNP